MKRIFCCLTLLFCQHCLAKQPLLYAFPVSPPYRTITETGKFEGMDFEIMTLIADQLNIELKPVVCPFSRCLMLLEHGELDIAGGLLKFKERESYLDFVEIPYYQSQMYYSFYRRTDNSITINRYEDIQGKSVALLRGGRYFPRFDNDRTIMKLPMPSGVELIDMVLRGRADLLIAVQSTLEDTFNTMGVSAQMTEVSYRQPHLLSVYVALSKSKQTGLTTGDICRAIVVLQKSGKIATILSKYQIEQEPAKPHPCSH